MAASVKHVFDGCQRARTLKTVNLFLLAAVEPRNLLRSGAGFGAVVGAGYSLETSVVYVVLLLCCVYP